MFHAEYLSSQRRKDLLREAEHQRLVQQVRGQRQPLKLRLPFASRLPSNVLPLSVAGNRAPAPQYTLPDCCAA